MDTLEQAWSELHHYLGHRAQLLVDEVRRYPGPIARCDDQLPKLLEERTRAFELLREAWRLEAERTADAGQWRADVQSFAARLDGFDDETLRAMRERLSRELAPA